MADAREMQDLAPPLFEPFYERVANAVSRSPLGRMVLPGALVLVCWAVIGDVVIDANSRTLTLLICVAMLALHYATHALRTCLPYMDEQTAKGGSNTHHAVLARLLSNRRFLLAGWFFGGVNTLLGFLFGVPAGREELFYGFFLVGFVCGMAALGIYGVTVMFRDFASNRELTIDYTAPDRCGGLRFVGDALIRFCAVTLFVGVGISYYILTAEWRSESQTVFVIRLFWVVFPYLLAAVVLLSPAFDMSRAMRTFKLQAETRMRAELEELRQELSQEDGSSEAARERFTALRARIEYREQRRRELHQMRTFPFGIGSNLRFAGVTASSAVITSLGIMNSAGSFWEKMVKLFAGT